jgi:capsular exopolysaccharide synthesis family protein
MQSNTAFRQEKVSVADEFLDQQLRQSADDLSQAEQKLAEFNQKNFPGLPQQGPSTEAFTGLEADLTNTENELKSAIDQRAAYERSLAEHKELKVAASAPGQPEPGAKNATTSTATQAPPPPVVRSPLQQLLAQRQQDLSSLLTRYKPDHPDVLRLKREMRDLQSEIASSESQKTAAAVPAPAVKDESKALPELDVAVDFFEAEMKSEMEQLNRRIVSLEIKKKELSGRVALYGRRMNMPADLMQQLSALTEDREMAKQRYSVLSTKKLNSDLAGKVDTDANNKTFTTIDPPNLPQLPVRPNRPMLAAGGSLVGLLIGVGLAFAREVLDPALSDQESAASALKLPVLTCIPTLGTGKRQEKRKAKRRKRDALALRLHPVQNPGNDDEKLSNFFSMEGASGNISDVVLGRARVAAEQYQMLRTGLNAQRQKGLKTLLVSSAIPDEGKTFVACCLAGFLAKEQDKKVLLIDGDLRTGSAGHSLGVDKFRPRLGLSDILAGKADIEDCLITCSELNLSFLPAGSSVQHPVELLSSPRLEQIMHDLTVLFDWLIVDSPPVLPIADTNVLNPICDSAVVVVRADRTPASLVNEAINKLGRPKIFGVVLNSVRDIKATHYYGHYYHESVKAQR